MASIFGVLRVESYNLAEKIFQRQVTKIGLSNCLWHLLSDRMFTDIGRLALMGNVRQLISAFWHTKPSHRKLLDPKRTHLLGKMWVIL